MVRKAMIERLTKLGEQTVNQAAEVLGKNKTLQDKLETVVKGGMAVKDEVEGNVKVVIDRLNLKNAVDLDGIKERLEPDEMVAEGATLEQQITLPRVWCRALDEFDAATVLPRYFGADYCRLFGTVRRGECEQFAARVSNVDYDWYLRSM